LGNNDEFGQNGILGQAPRSKLLVAWATTQFHRSFFQYKRMFMSIQ